jgi:hypothetical protein
MGIYVLSVKGRSLAAIQAPSTAHAADRVRDLEFRDDLMSLASDGVPLWDGVTPIEVRDARAAEELRWRASRARAVRHGSIDSDDEGWIAFLVPLTDPERPWR